VADERVGKRWIRARDLFQRLAEIQFESGLRREQRHLRVFFRQLESDIRDHHPQRQGFDADFLIGIFTPGIKESKTSPPAWCR
jgi:transposase